MKVLYSCLRKFVFAELVRSMCCCIIISNWMGFIMFISLLCYFLLYVFCSVRMYVSYHLIERFLLLNNRTKVLQLHFLCVFISPSVRMKLIQLLLDWRCIFRNLFVVQLEFFGSNPVPCGHVRFVFVLRQNDVIETEYF